MKGVLKLGDIIKEYSPIESFYTENYRTIGEVLVDFTKSPIVVLAGGNDAGKTSTVKSIINLMYNSNNSECKKHIRTGTKKYKSVLKLQSGLQIEREKSLEGLNGYKMLLGNNTICEYNKIETKENGIVPPEISAEIGVVWEKETRELLNIRTYESLLLFSLTSGSDNYRIMYNALKIGDINKAIRIGKDEVNEYNNSIKTNLNSINGLQSSIQSIRLFDLEPVKLTKEKVSVLRDTVVKLHNIVSKIERVKQCQEQIERLDATSNLQPIDVVSVNSMLRLGDAISRKKQAEGRLGESSLLETVQSVNVGTLEKMGNLVAKLNRLKGISSQVNNMNELDKLVSIDDRIMLLMGRLIESKKKLDTLNKSVSADDERWIAEAKPVGEQIITKFQQLFSGINKVQVANQSLNASMQEETEIMAEIAKSGHYNEELGGFVKLCPDCGSQVIVTLDELLTV